MLCLANQKVVQCYKYSSYKRQHVNICSPHCLDYQNRTMGCTPTKLKCCERSGRLIDVSADIRTQCSGMENTFHLYRAIQQNNFHKAECIMENGGSVNCMNYLGGNPLIETCRCTNFTDKKKERERFVRFLIRNGSDVGKSDMFGWTALLYAKENGHQAIAMLLEKLERRRKTGKII